MSYEDAIAEAEIRRQAQWEKIKVILLDRGIEESKITTQMKEKLLLLAEHTDTLDDEAQAMDFAIDLNRFYKERDLDVEFSDDEMADVFEGSFATDIGKTGPREASTRLSTLIAKLYGLKGARADEVLFEKARQIDPDQAEELLESVGFTQTSTMRDLYNRHVYWSYEIIKDTGFSERAKLAAGAHHILDGENGNYPRELFDETGKILSGEFTGEYIGKVELLVMLLDKYDAQRTRARVSHEQAIKWLRSLESLATYQRLNESVKKVFESLIDDLEQALKVSELHQDTDLSAIELIAQ